MGNSGSSHREPPPSHSWTLSYPRHPKVLPERYPGQRLRVTNNGVLLHTVGTINRHGYGPPHPVPMHRFGSEPDLRFTGREFISYNNESPSKQRISRSKKKYKAPTPVTNGMDSSSPDSYQPWDTSAENSEVQAPVRKSRLFKTHAETKAPTRITKIPPLHRSLSSPQFHEELLEATQKLRKRSKSPLLSNSIECNSSNISSNHLVNSNQMNHHDSTNPASPRLQRGANPTSPRPNVRETQIQPNIRKQSNVDSHYLNNNKENVFSNSQQMREVIKVENVKNNWENIKPVKTFYFGMQEDDQTNSASRQTEAELDRFAASITPRCSPSIELLEEEDTNNISLHLRPTLPRKQLDIPRFSPTAAWRLLSALESPTQSHSEDDDLVIPHVHDKSVDSGISGDASPHLDSAHNSQAAWTPQQDLEETSSDGGMESSPVTPDALGVTKFSLSLPRDSNKAQHSFTMLQSNGWMTDVTQDSSLVDENWVLSRSVPSSLHLQRWPEPDTKDYANNIQSLPYFAKAGPRVMYLPEYQPQRTPHSMQDMSSFSKSLDNLVIQSQREREAEEDPIEEVVEKPLKSKKSKKFTFQSTVRQIERRKIAEKLSKQAEQKERQRLMELETMQRVEAEFQKKREREKADIRQQLRLYTHVLSEFKQPSRDYKDYTPNSNRTEVTETPSQVIHPQVVYQMPKSTQVYVVANSNPTNSPSTLSDNSNYRRDFAQGVLPRSGSELSQPISHRSSSPEGASKDRVDPIVKPEETKIDEPPLPPARKRSEIPKPPPPPEETSSLEPAAVKTLKPSVVLTSLLQPFDRNKSYRPIAFTPNPNSNLIAG